MPLPFSMLACSRSYFEVALSIIFYFYSLTVQKKERSNCLDELTSTEPQTEVGEITNIGTTFLQPNKQKHMPAPTVYWTDLKVLIFDKTICFFFFIFFYLLLFFPVIVLISKATRE